MVHPDTEIRLIDSKIGYGIFATKRIPEGTIVYVKDKLDILISEEQFEKHNEVYQKLIRKYSYIDRNGNRVLVGI